MPSTARFYKAYKKQTGKLPDGNFVVGGADLVDLISAAILKAGSTDPTKVRDAYASLRNVPATSGPISFAGAPLYHVPKKDVFILKWQGTSRVCLKHFYPKSVPAIQ